MNFFNSNLDYLITHIVGNKQNDEELFISSSPIDLSDNIFKANLQSYFLSPFKTNELYNFYHETDLFLNTGLFYSSSIFEDLNTFISKSQDFAKFLYEKSLHPKIKGGELFIAHFSNCIIENTAVNAIGIFKTENKDSFIKFNRKDSSIQILCDNGVNLNKFDKGCLIFNLEKEKGYIVSIIDSTNKGVEAQFWRDDFLHIQPRNDDFYQTKNFLSICKNYITEKLPSEFEVSKADQIDLLNKSVSYFKDNDEFSLKEFSEEVIKQPEIVNSFSVFKNNYISENNIDIQESFSISDSAVKKQSRAMKNIIKLDKNFHIYIHGNRENIIKGYDEKTGLNYYQLFYKEEN